MFWAISGSSAPDDGQTVTPVVRGTETVALLAHRPELVDDRDLAGEIGEAARLVLDNERLHAQTRAQLATCSPPAPGS